MAHKLGIGARFKVFIDSPSLHGKSLVYDQSPDLVICDYSRGIISDQSTFKLKIKKSKEYGTIYVGDLYFCVGCCVGVNHNESLIRKR